ncbi:M24 family metallopeptidase, partial [Streptosporangium algeriense]
LTAAEAVLLMARELAWFGTTERAMARRLWAMMVETGCEEVLSVVVAAGEHSALARHVPCDRVINPGDALLVSICGRWSGYCSEVARVFAVAEPPDDFEAMYSVVLAAQDAILDALRPGLTAAQAGRVAREVIEGSGYGNYAVPCPGRGIGLGHEEDPRFLPGEETVLAEGTTVCVEPAIYLPELFGARVADVAVCAHVVYNVPDLAAFLTELSGHARVRVVVELTERHPMTWLNPLWAHFHGIVRPDRPTAHDVIAVAEALGHRVS